MPAGAVGVKVRSEIIERQVPTHIAVKFAIDGVSRISNLSAPDLTAGFDVTGKNSCSVRARDGCVNAVFWTRITVQDRVGVTDEIFNSRIGPAMVGTAVSTVVVRRCR